MAAGHRPGSFAMLSERGDRTLQGRGTYIVECVRDHVELRVGVAARRASWIARQTLGGVNGMSMC